MKNLNLKINGKEIEIKSENRIELPKEVKTPQNLFLSLKKYGNEIESVSATTEEFDKEILSAISSCKNFYYKDKKDGIEISRNDGDISLRYGNTEIYTGNKSRPGLSDKKSEMFRKGNTSTIEPLVNDNREKYEKLFQLYPVVKSKNQIFDLTFTAGEHLKIDKKVKDIPNFSLIIEETFVLTMIGDYRIDEITFHSEYCEPKKSRPCTTSNLLLRFKDTKIKFDNDNNATICHCNGNKYIFSSNEMTDIDTNISIEEMQRDLKEIKKLLELSLNLTDNYRAEEIIETIENIGEFSEFKNKMEILEDFETL